MTTMARGTGPPMSSQARRSGRALPVTIAALVGTGILVLALVFGAALTKNGDVDPVSTCALSDLDQFVGWLRVNHAQGYIGEVGWPAGPDSDRWNNVADSWFDRADEAGLWVTAWAAGRWWPRSYPMAVYRLSGRSDVPPLAGPQADVLAQHRSSGSQLRGVVLPGGAFGAGRDGPVGYSTDHPGTAGRDYYYPDLFDYAQLSALGVSLVRLSFTWERVQHRPLGPLDTSEIARIRRSLQAADQAGVGVILDLHNFGEYWAPAPGHDVRTLRLGDPGLPGRALADLWGRLSQALGSSPAVLGYGLMNEPSDLADDSHRGAALWERISQQSVDEIRAGGDQHTLFVAGYGGSSTGRFGDLHPRAWIADPRHQVRYEAHQYFDADRSGQYSASFADESKAMSDQAQGACDTRLISTTIPSGRGSSRPTTPQ